MAERILVVEDEPHIQELIEFNLKSVGYEVMSALRGDEALKLAQQNKPDLVLLDLMLPGMSGFEVCRALRARPETEFTPVIMLTARGAESDKVLGFELGTDDYVTKPFSVPELLARVKAVLKRTALRPGRQPQSIEIGELKMDLTSHKLTLSDQVIGLTLTEFKILKELMISGEKVLSRADLVGEVIGSEVNVTDRTIDVHLAALRKKLGSEADRIETVRGVGYRFRTT